MFIPISKTAIDWSKFLTILPTELIQSFDKQQIKFDTPGTYIKALQAMSAQDVVYCHLHYTFGFRLELETIYELITMTNAKTVSVWEEGKEIGIITASLKDWRDFVICFSKHNSKPQLRKLANVLYVYFRLEKLAVIFDEFIRKDLPDSTFILMETSQWQ